MGGLLCPGLAEMNAVVGLLVVFCSFLLLDSSHQEDSQFFNGARNKRAVAVGDPLNTETTTTEAPEPPEPTDPPRTSWRRRNRVGGARNSTTGSRRSLRKTRLGGARNSTTGGSRRRSRTNRIQSSGNSTVAGSRASRRNRRKNRRLQQQASTTEAP